MVSRLGFRFLIALFFGLFGSLKTVRGVNDTIFHRITGRYLGKNVIQTLKTKTELECGIHCSNEVECVAANFKETGNNKGLCELNLKTLDEIEDGGQNLPEYIYLGIIERQCKENEEFSVETKRCKENFTSCRDALTRYKNSTDGIYSLKSAYSGKYYQVYCHMTDIANCGGGGWTLAMKMDGKKKTFTYDSPLWTNNEAYALADGLQGLTDKESKLASYWNIPFTKICLGMSNNGHRKWMVLDYTETSLLSVFADGQFKSTTATRISWKSLIAGSSLQLKCNQQGFNIRFNSNHRMRIGIRANSGRSCISSNSWLGFGIDTPWKNVCGNVANGCCNPDNGAKNLTTFGYILIQ